MQTSRFSISPLYNTREVTRCSELFKEVEPATSGTFMGMPVPDSPDVVDIVVMQKEGSGCRMEFERVLNGYEVTNTLNIKVRDLDNMGNVIDEARGEARRPADQGRRHG